MYKATLKAWVAMLGVDPNDVSEITVFPDEIVVYEYVRGMDGEIERTVFGPTTGVKVIRVLD